MSVPLGQTGPDPLRQDQRVGSPVRRALAADERGVIGVDARALAGDQGRLAYLRAAIQNRSCLVAEANGILGYVVLEANHFYDRDFIALLMVHPDSRRRGVGRALLRAAVADARTDRVFSSTNRSNIPMQGLFAAEGWTLSGSLEGLDDGDPELVYFTDRTGH